MLHSRHVRHPKRGEIVLANELYFCLGHCNSENVILDQTHDHLYRWSCTTKQPKSMLIKEMWDDSPLEAIHADLLLFCAGGSESAFRDLHTVFADFSVRLSNSGHEQYTWGQTIDVVETLLRRTGNSITGPLSRSNYKTAISVLYCWGRSL